MVIGLVIFFGTHQIDEGHIGIYWVGGALSESWTEPGIRWMTPFITKFANVQVTLQTDTVTNIPCGTSGGTTVYFDKIEVVNRLDKSKALNTIKLYGVNYDRTWIFDRIHHEINQFCSSHTLQEVYIDLFEKLDEALATSLQTSCDKHETGITIISIRVTKPRIPEAVRKNYEAIETAKTELLVRQQQERVAKKEEEIKRVRAKIQAEKEAEVARINAEKMANISKIKSQREILEKEAEQKKRLIDDEIAAHHKTMLSDAEYYTSMKVASSNQELFSPEYLRYVLYTTLAKNTKVYFGSNMKDIFRDLLPTNSSIPFP
uniref:Band 7 domain-containing protein n=1 Tax=Arcella intermedia TaxID=1963864 RepID=A0A6B2LA96_9EUKA